MARPSALWSRWKTLARKAGTFQSKTLLWLFYFLVIPPFAVVIKIFSDPLRLKNSPPVKWHPKEAEQENLLKESQRQF